MSPNSDPIRSLPPLNIGNVVSVGVTLYRSHLQSYLNIALTAFLWYLPALLTFVIIQVVVINTRMRGTFSLSLPLLLLFPVAIAFLIYGGAKYCFNAALIARLAFQELINQPETEASGRSKMKNHPWGFFWIALRVGLILVGVYLLSAFVAGFIIAAVAISRQPVATFAVTTLIFLIILAVLTWFIACWIVAELPLATGEVSQPGQSVDRSWELTASSIFRVQGVVSLTFLVTLPLLAVANYIPQLFLLRLEQGSITYWLMYGVLTLLSFVVGIITLPFWQTVKAVLYYDLRNRREGLGLQLTDRPRLKP